jgi:hypothetical protein
MPGRRAPVCAAGHRARTHHQRLGGSVTARPTGSDAPPRRGLSAEDPLPTSHLCLQRRLVPPDVIRRRPAVGSFPERADGPVNQGRQPPTRVSQDSSPLPANPHPVRVPHYEPVQPFDQTPPTSGRRLDPSPPKLDSSHRRLSAAPTTSSLSVRVPQPVPISSPSDAAVAMQPRHHRPASAANDGRTGDGPHRASQRPPTLPRVRRPDDTCR